MDSESKVQHQLTKADKRDKGESVLNGKERDNLEEDIEEKSRSSKELESMERLDSIEVDCTEDKEKVKGKRSAFFCLGTALQFSKLLKLISTLSNRNLRWSVRCNFTKSIRSSGKTHITIISCLLALCRRWARRQSKYHLL